MDGKDKIGEIRGIADNQNMESEMMPILEEKLKEFPDRDKYLKKEHDMKLLTLIDKKVNDNVDLTLDELKFLYEIDGKITGFGYEKDPRIEEIKRKRNKRRDYSLIYNVKEEEVALSQEECLNNPEKFKVFPGNIYLSSLTSADGLVLPHDFCLFILECPYNIREEIMNNPDKYYMEPPTEEDKKGIKK